MSKLNNPLEIYKLLPKSNCKQCGLATCMAFAAEVIKGQKRLEECPHLSSNVIEEYGGKIIKQATPEEQLTQLLVPLKKEIAKMNFSSSIKRLGARLEGDKLVIKSLGKDFTIDREGDLLSNCHINVWVTVPLLNYIIYSAGNDCSGNWVPFRELSKDTVWDAFFIQRFEKPLKQLTDAYPELIEDIIGIFSGKPIKNTYSSDISLVLHPLPKLPMLICYTKPEGDIESKLNVFFDSSAEENLNIDSIYRISVGLLMMFQKISARHTKPCN